MIVIITAIGLLAYISTVVSLYYRNFIWVNVSMVLLGGLQALIPISIDLAVEICYPVAESITNGLLLSSANIIGIILTITQSAVIQI